MTTLFEYHDIAPKFKTESRVAHSISKSNHLDLDKYYTNPSIAKACYASFISILKKHVGVPAKDCFFIEPSAGAGAFLDIIKGDKIGFDIHPESKNIVRADFLTHDIENFIPPQKIPVIIGNPPFGKNSSLAIQFLNRSFKYADFIGFILPKTFKKDSVRNRINLNFDCIYQADLPDYAFTFMGEPYDVPCVFQIWAKSKIRGVHKGKTTSALFSFVDKDQADFAIRRVGGHAGKLFTSFEQYQPASNYFIKCHGSKIKFKKLVVSSFEHLNKIAQNCAGNPSLSKTELVAFIDDHWG